MGLSFQTWVMPNQWTVIRYLAKFQAERCGWNRQITSNTHVHQLYSIFSHQKKKKHHLLWALTSHISRVPLQNLVLMLWFLPGFLAQVEQGGPPARGFGPPAARKPVHAPALMWLLCRTTQGRKEVTAINCWTAPFPSCQTMCDTSCSNKVSDTSNQRRINGWWQCFCIHLGLLNNYRPKIVKLPKSWWNTLKKKQGFPFHSEGLGVEAVFPRRCATAHNHAHLSTTVRVRAVWPCLW